MIAATKESLMKEVEQVQAAAESWTPQQALRWAFDTFGKDVAIASAFGVEGMVLIDIASKLTPKFRLFSIDTDFLFPETYALMEKVDQRYGIQIEKVYSKLSPAEQEKEYGPALWSHNPDQCCYLRKVEPQKRKIAELNAWVAAIRRDQTSNRASAKRVEWDTKFDIVKINPMVDWTSNQVWQYVRDHDVPYNVLHDRNYPSIGCTHCTRAVQPGEDPRSGRWANFGKTECGLHLKDAQEPLVQLPPPIKYGDI